MGLKRVSYLKFVHLTALVLLCTFISPIALAKSNSASVSSNTMSFSRLESGQYLVDVMVDNQGPFVFMIDTAATRSCIFEKTLRQLDIAKTPDGEALIRGMTEARIRPTIKLSNISFGGKSVDDHSVVILKDWEDMHEQLDGILGIELLQDMVLSFSHKGKRIRIRKRFNPRAVKFRDWDQVKLIPTPYPGEDFGLMFTGAKIGETIIPAVLDTGSNFTTINWVSVKGTKLEKEKQRLRDEWVVQGAVGEFKPSMVVKLDRLTIGGIQLPKHELLLMDLDNFPVNGNGKFPLVIAGIDLMGSRDFVLDLKKKVLYVEPRGKGLAVRPNASRILRREGL